MTLSSIQTRPLNPELQKLVDRDRREYTEPAIPAYTRRTREIRTPDRPTSQRQVNVDGLSYKPESPYTTRHTESRRPTTDEYLGRTWARASGQSACQRRYLDAINRPSANDSAARSQRTEREEELEQIRLQRGRGGDSRPAPHAESVVTTQLVDTPVIAPTLHQRLPEVCVLPQTPLRPRESTAHGEFYGREPSRRDVERRYAILNTRPEELQREFYNVTVSDVLTHRTTITVPVNARYNPYVNEDPTILNSRDWLGSFSKDFML